MTNPEQQSRNRFELEDLDDAKEASRYVKCNLEQTMEALPDTVTTVEIDINEVAHRDRR